MVRAYLAIGVVTLLWAGNFTAGKIGMEQLDPYLVASIRIFGTAAVFYALLPREQRRLERSDWKAILPLSVTGIALNHVCFAAGIQLTLPSHSAVIHALIPVCVGVVAWVVLKEKLGVPGIVGMGLAVAGALVVVLGVSREEKEATLWGDVVTTVGIVGFSVYTVYGRKALGRMGSFRAVTFGFVFAVPVMVPCLVAGLLRQDWARVTWQGWTALAYMFVCANLICYRFHIFALEHLKASQVAAFTTLQPALGIGIAVLAGRDRVTGSLVAGAALALLGVVFVQSRR